ncbi:type IX secretion system plug protein [Flavobacteriaceae bacterium 14752]|uniref:type IX secretion system plug protein n=1 Tax=Mesohalobacter salilacus TaxID=2491711 RepID=UPI000F640EF2|nr:DUF5103 domain-containing protein [Flavobacteriaceae bacterium 14752]
MKNVFVSIFILTSALLSSQDYEVLPPDYIKTIQFTGQADLTGTPVISLNDNLNLSFDDIRAEVADFYYKIEHFDYDWTPSKLAKNEYIEGFDNIRIFDFKNSLTTLQPYTHYELQIPNKNTRQLKVSGNYMLKIFNSDRQLVFSRKFMVFNRQVDVQAQVRRSRDLKEIGKKQLLQYSVSRDGFIFKNPQQNVNTVIVKNNDFKSAIYDIKPQFTSGNTLVFNYPQKTAFWGGNEYLYFDNRDIRVSTINIQRVELFDLYHTYLNTDRVRQGREYVYNPDINGSFKINTVQGQDVNRESEYAVVHFSLDCRKDLNGGELHVYGRFNNYSLTDETHLDYNKKTGLFETQILLKQGFYNYKYVYLSSEGEFNDHFISGSFDITENDYTILVYYRNVGARFDALIGVGSASSRNIVN